MRFKDTISGVDGVAVGLPATIKPLTGRRHLMLDFKFTATTTGASPVAITNVADIVGNVEQYVGNKLVRNSTADEIIRIAKFNKIPTVDNRLPIYYAEPRRASVMDEQVTAWEMKGVSDFLVKPTFKSDIASLAVAEAVDIYDYEQATINGAKARNILFHEPQTWTAGGAGLLSITNIPLGHPINRIYFSVSAGTITRVEVIADGVKVHDMTKEGNDKSLSDYDLDGTQFAYALCLDEHGQVFNNLFPRQNLTINVYTSEACVVRGLIETLRGDY